MIVIKNETQLKKELIRMIAEQDMPLQTIADFSQVSQATISNWLAGRRNPQSGHLIRVLDVLGVDLIFRDRKEKT